jgi:hypothetical protein
MKRGYTLTVGLGIALAVLAGSVSVANAQYPPPPGYGPPPGYYPPARPRGVYRDGLVIGAALGGGTIAASDCPACGGGLAGEFHIGGMLNPRLAIEFDASTIWHPYGDSQTLTNSFFLGALQYWATDQLWLKGGIGLAEITLSDNIDPSFGTSESAFGVMGAGGFEIVQTPSFALDLQLRIQHGTYSGGGATNLALLVGLNWY